MIRMPRTSARSRAVAACNCVKATHVHGTRDMYGWHSCKCVPCTAANRDYYRATAHLTRKHQWADAEPARRRVLLLKEAGLSVKAMAEMCQVSASQLNLLVRGPKGREVKRVYATTLQALNAISYKDIAATPVPAGAYVPGAAARLQLQALTAAGWSMASLAKRTGLGRGTLIGILNGRNTREGVRVKIEAAHEALLLTSPPLATRYERSAAGAARARAAASGWTIHQADTGAGEAA